MSGYTGVADSQANRENYIYANTGIVSIGTTSTVLLDGPPQDTGIRITLSTYFYNGAGSNRTFQLRILPDGGVDDTTKNFFNKLMTPGESFLLPSIVLKGDQTLKAIADGTGVQAFCNYKQEI